VQAHLTVIIRLVVVQALGTLDLVRVRVRGRVRVRP